jgi:hypothetical protein
MEHRAVSSPTSRRWGRSASSAIASSLPTTNSSRCPSALETTTGVESEPNNTPEGLPCETQSDHPLLAAVFPMCHSAASWLTMNTSRRPSSPAATDGAEFRRSPAGAPCETHWDQPFLGAVCHMCTALRRRPTQTAPGGHRHCEQQPATRTGSARPSGMNANGTTHRCGRSAMSCEALHRIPSRRVEDRHRRRRPPGTRLRPVRPWATSADHLHLAGFRVSTNPTSRCRRWSANGARVIGRRRGRCRQRRPPAARLRRERPMWLVSMPCWVLQIGADPG